MKREGKVTRFGANGYGFLTDTASRIQYFFHARDVHQRIEPRAGDKVLFEAGPQRPGCAQHAINVVIVGGVQ